MTAKEEATVVGHVENLRASPVIESASSIPPRFLVIGANSGSDLLRMRPKMPNAPSTWSQAPYCWCSLHLHSKILVVPCSCHAAKVANPNPSRELHFLP